MLRPPLAVVVLLGLCASVLAAPRPVARETLHFALWHPGDRQDLAPVQRIITTAQRAYPGLQIILVRLPTADPYRQLQEWCKPGARGAPDVVMVRDLWLADFASYLRPLNALLQARDTAHYPESVKRRLRFAGNLYGVPWTVEARALLCRRDLLDEAGLLPPRTWEELVVAARRLHKPPQVYGIGLPGIRDYGACELLLTMLWSLGTDLPPVEAPETLDLEKLKTALRLYAELHAAAEPEVLSWDTPALEDFFQRGRLAMLIADKSFQDHLARAAPELKVEASPLPSGSARAGFISLDLVCILKSSPHCEAAVKFLRTLTTREACENLLALGGVPFHNELITQLLPDRRYGAYAATLENARGLPPQRWWSGREALSEGLFCLLTGRSTPQEAADVIRARLATVPAFQKSQD